MLSLTLALTLAASAAAPGSSTKTTSVTIKRLSLQAPTLKLAQAGYNAAAPTSPPPAEAVPAGTTPSPSTAPAPSAPASAASSGPPGLAAPGTEHRGLSLWLGLPYYYGGFGFGIGARFALPLAIPSLLRHSRIHDSWSLEFGGDFYRYSVDYALGTGAGYSYSVSWLLPVCGMMWNVWLNEKFAVYPKAEAGYAIAWESGTQAGYVSSGYGHVYVAAVAGLIYKVSDSFTLRAEAGSFGLKGGVGFVF